MLRLDLRNLVLHIGEKNAVYVFLVIEMQHLVKCFQKTLVRLK